MIAVFEPELRLTPHAHTVRCAGKNQISGGKREYMCEISNEFGYVENQLRSIGILYCFAIENTANARL